MLKEEFLEVGREKLRILRFQEALAQYEKAIGLDASCDAAWYGKATALEGLGRYGEAIEAFERSESLCPNGINARARFSIANNRVHLGDIVRALDDFAAALAVDPGLERAWHNRACLLLDLRRLEEAADDFARAAALDPGDVRIALYQGYCLGQLGREAEAKACFARAEATQNWSDLARIWQEMGARMLIKQRPEAAIDAYERASQMNPRWGIPWLGRGAALCRLERHDEALSAFDRAIASNDEATLLGWAAKADVFAAQGRPAAAREADTRVVSVLARSSGDHRAQGRAHRRLRQYDQALAALAKAHALERSDPIVLMEQAECLEEAMRRAEAIAVLEDAVVRFPNFAEGWRRLAVTMLAAGQHERTVTCAEKAIALGDGSSVLDWTIGCGLLASGRLDAAEASFAAAVSKEPRSVAAWFNLAICRIRLGKKTESLSALDRTLALSPQLSDALRAKYHVLHEMGRTTEADSVAALGVALDALNAEPQQTQEGVDRLRQSIGLDPNNLLAGRIFGEMLIQADQFLEQAEGHLARWTEAWPDDDGAWQTRAQALKKLGRGAEATACYTKAVAANPHSARALRNASIDAFAGKRYEEALALATRSLQIEGENSNAWYAVGACRATLGKLPEAVDAFRQAVLFDPSDMEAWKDMTTCLFSLARYGEAAEAWKKVLELDPTVDPDAPFRGSGKVPLRVPGTSNVYVLDEGSIATEEHRRGVSLLARGDLRGAAGAFDEALRNDPQVADVWVERGICAEVLDGPERALDFFDRALAINPDFVRALYNKGVSLARLEKHEEAIQTYQRVLSLHDSNGLPVNEDYMHALHNLGSELLFTRELESALDCFDRVLIIMRTASGVWQEEARRAERGKNLVYSMARRSASP